MSRFNLRFLHLSLFLCIACAQPRRSIDKAQDIKYDADRARWSIERARRAKDTNQKIDAILDALEALDEAQGRTRR